MLHQLRFTTEDRLQQAIAEHRGINNDAATSGHITFEPARCYQLRQGRCHDRAPPRRRTQVVHLWWLGPITSSIDRRSVACVPSSALASRCRTNRGISGRHAFCRANPSVRRAKRRILTGQVISRQGGFQAHLRAFRCHFLHTTSIPPTGHVLARPVAARPTMDRAFDRGSGAPPDAVQRGRRA